MKLIGEKLAYDYLTYGVNYARHNILIRSYQIEYGGTDVAILDSFCGAVADFTFSSSITLESWFRLLEFAMPILGIQ